MLSKHLWAVPLLGALVFALVGLWVRSRVEETTRAELAARLQTVLQADINALRLWFTERQYDAKSLALDLRIQAAIAELAALAKDTNTTALALANSACRPHLAAPPAAARCKRRIISPTSSCPRTNGFWPRPTRRMVGIRAPRPYDLFLNKALDGQLAASRPFARQANLGQRVEGPTMFVAAPVKSTNDAVIAVLCLRMKPEKEFSSIFSVARMGETGESYAFDRSGLMLTATRFDPELKTLGLIPPGRENTAILNLKLLDPEQELRPGETPAKPRNQLNLTRMAASATMGNNDFDVRGYRNYRGMEVVGAWAWLHDYGMGVATEQSVDEAFETLYVLRRAFLVLFVLLVASGGAIFGFTFLVERLADVGAQERARRPAARPIRAGAGDRARGQRDGVPRPPFPAPPPGGHQAAQPGHDQRDEHRPLRARGPDDQPAHPSEYCRDL